MKVIALEEFQKHQRMWAKRGKRGEGSSLEPHHNRDTALNPLPLLAACGMKINDRSRPTGRRVTRLERSFIQNGKIHHLERMSSKPPRSHARGMSTKNHKV